MATPSTESTLPFGERARRESVLLVDLAFGLALFGIAWLWNETPVGYSFVWTAGTAFVLGLAATRYGGWAALRGPGALAGGFFLVFPVSCVLSYLITSAADAAKEAAMIQDAKEWLLCLLYFALGYLASRHLGTAAVRVTFAACALYILSKREVFMDLERFHLVGLERGRDLNYQHIGDAFVVAGVLLIQQFESVRARLLLFAASLIPLALIPSRSSAVLGAVCLFIATFRGQWRQALGVGLVLAAVGGLLLDSRMLAELLAGTRLEALLFPQEDVSFQERSAAMREGWQAIALHPLVGLYQFQLDAFDNPGLYIHNLLNTWAQAGIVAFLLITGFLVRLTWQTLRVSRRGGASAAPALLLFALMSWSYSRTTMSALMFACAGFALGSLAGAGAGACSDRDHDDDDDDGNDDGNAGPAGVRSRTDR